MKRIKDFWIACINCKDKSLCNFELDIIHEAVIFTCYNCGNKEALVLTGTTPPLDKEDFQQQTIPIAKMKRKNSIKN